MAATCAVIVNPRSQHGRVGREMAALERSIGAELGSRYDVVFHETAAPEDATRLTRQALVGGAALVLAVGGDGTFHEVVNGFFDEGRPVRDVPLALLSRGTGGDTRRTLGLPLDIPTFAAMVAAGRTRRIDLGLAEFRGHDGTPRTKVFLNVADLGISGDVVSRANRSSKRWGGFLTFLGSTLAVLASFQPKEVEVALDEAPPERITLVFLAIGNCRYFGGGMQIAPTADPSDGLLDVVTVSYQGRTPLFMKLHRIYSGTHLGLPGVTHARVRSLRATPTVGDVLLDLDGEQPGKLPVTIRVLPAALSVYIP